MSLWQTGRSSPNNYFKLKLVSFWFFDCYILKFPQGSSIDWHTDPASSGKLHHRMNFFLKRAKLGGQIKTKFYVLDGERYGSHPLIFRHKSRIHYMRPDITEHSVSEVKKGSAYLLSIGWHTREAPSLEQFR